MHKRSKHSGDHESSYKDKSCSSGNSQLCFPHLGAGVKALPVLF